MSVHHNVRNKERGMAMRLTDRSFDGKVTLDEQNGENGGVVKAGEIERRRGRELLCRKRNQERVDWSRV